MLFERILALVFVFVIVCLPVVLVWLVCLVCFGLCSGVCGVLMLEIC